jgi:SAM-dependent methyltransferase
MKIRHKYEKLLKKILFRLGLLNLISKIRNKTFFLLRNGYAPREFWNDWSDIYYNQPYRKEVNQSHFWLLERTKRISPQSILEVGCGFGKNIKLLDKNTTRPTKFFGLDISESMVKKAKTYMPKNAFFLCGDILNLPFPDSCFDLVFTHGSLMHVSPENLPQAIQEIRRTAKNDIIIIEEVLWGNIQQKKTITQLNEYTFIHDYKKIFTDFGFETKDMKKHEDYVDLICMHCCVRK